MTEKYKATIWQWCQDGDQSGFVDWTFSTDDPRSLRQIATWAGLDASTDYPPSEFKVDVNGTMFSSIELGSLKNVIIELERHLGVQHD